MINIVECQPILCLRGGWEYMDIVYIYWNNYEKTCLITLERQTFFQVVDGLNYEVF